MSEVARFPALLTESQAADVLGVSVYTVQRMRKRGQLKAKKIGARWKYRDDWLREYLETPDTCPANETTDPAPSAASGSLNAPAPRCGTGPGSTATADRLVEHHSALRTLRRPS